MGKMSAEEVNQGNLEREEDVGRHEAEERIDFLKREVFVRQMAEAYMQRMGTSRNQSGISG